MRDIKNWSLSHKVQVDVSGRYMVCQVVSLNLRKNKISKLSFHVSEAKKNSLGCYRCQE